jgi:hypothetical protein
MVWVDNGYVGVGLSVPHHKVEALAKQLPTTVLPCRAAGDQGELPVGLTKCSSSAAVVQRTTSIGVLSREIALQSAATATRAFLTFVESRNIERQNGGGGLHQLSI